MSLIATLPTRAQDWEERLDRFVKSRRSTPFAWGTHDCCLFAADAIESMTGVDIAVKFRGKYDSLASCMSVLKGFGYTDIESMIRAELKSWQFTPVAPVRAHRGDLAMCNLAAGPALCVVGMNGKESIGVGESGLMKLRTYHDFTQAWHVPFMGEAR